MSLTSVSYLIFLLVVTLIYYAVSHQRRIFVLLAACGVFYYLNQGPYLLILLFSIIVNYSLCHMWAKSQSKWYIYGAVALDILLLAFFKYLPGILGLEPNPEGGLLERMALPVGLSFFTFQGIGYCLDMYWGGKRKQAGIADFALYMSFFPQLLAGPIARSKSFFPQISRVKSFDYGNIVGGGVLILWGLFKKLVVANNLSPYTDAVFNNVRMHDGFTFVIAAIAYMVQLYTDFSGYADIAIGSALMLGFKLMENFRVPFFAKSVTDFWRRWHISLSSWVRDYVNTPLQYKMRAWGKSGVILAIFITFLIIGVWHGASWNFVIFGLIQGLAITWELLTEKYRSAVRKHLPGLLFNAISNVIVFGFFAISLTLLRAKNLQDAIYMVANMSVKPDGFYWGSKQLIIYSIIGAGCVWLLEFLKGDELLPAFIASKKLAMRWSFYIFCTLTILLIGSLSSENFIYFQF